MSGVCGANVFTSGGCLGTLAFDVCVSKSVACVHDFMKATVQHISDKNQESDIA